MANTGNTQQIIDYGATANDGQGDPLRTAFIKTDENFSNIWAAGPVGSNITIVDNTIGVQNTNGNLILSPNGVGIVESRNTILPGIDSVYDLGSVNNYWRDGYIRSLSVSSAGISGDLSVSGNIIVQGNIIEVGNITTDSKLIHLANTFDTPLTANRSGIVVGANSNIASWLWYSNGAGWSSDSAITVYNNSILIDSTLGAGNRWSINGAFLTAPTGLVWSSNKEFKTDFITSAPGGYIDITTTKSGNTFSESTTLHIDQDYFEFSLYDGVTSKWRFTSAGNTSFPHYVFPALDGSSGQTFLTDGAGNLHWASVSNYSNANVVDLLANFGSNTISTTGNISVGGISSTGVYNIGNIPNAVSAGPGARAFVNDADTRIFANIYVGGSSNSVPVYSDGVDWYIG